MFVLRFWIFQIIWLAYRVRFWYLLNLVKRRSSLGVHPTNDLVKSFFSKPASVRIRHQFTTNWVSRLSTRQPIHEGMFQCKSYNVYRGCLCISLMCVQMVQRQWPSSVWIPDSIPTLAIAFAWIKLNLICIFWWTPCCYFPLFLKQTRVVSQFSRELWSMAAIWSPDATSFKLRI